VRTLEAMPKRVNEPAAQSFRLRFRVFCGEDIALGPGKVQLLKLVQDTGSIRQAAAQMEMSYMRAWGLIRTMNRCFNEPLVESARGGSQRGGAKLTPAGATVLELYEQMETESLVATAGTRRKLAALLSRSTR
jgi:molybdate transport system regulatory protein